MDYGEKSVFPRFQATKKERDFALSFLYRSPFGVGPIAYNLMLNN